MCFRNQSIWKENKQEKNDWSCKGRHKLEGIGVGRARKLTFSSNSAYDSLTHDPVKTRLMEPQAEVEEQINHTGTCSSEALSAYNSIHLISTRYTCSNTLHYNLDPDTVVLYWVVPLYMCFLLPFLQFLHHGKYTLGSIPFFSLSA